MMSSYGVKILEGESEIVQIRNQKLRLCGVDDPAAFESYKNIGSIIFLVGFEYTAESNAVSC